MADNDKLIALIKKQPCLYDHEWKHFKNNAQKRAIWADIAAQLKLESIDTVKNKWRCLRDAYVKYLKAKKKGIKRKRWYWANEMRFLKPYLSGYSNDQDEVMDEGNDSTNQQNSLQIEEIFLPKEETSSQLSNDDSASSAPILNHEELVLKSEIVDEIPLASTSSYNVSDYFNNKPIDNKMNANTDAIDLLFLSYAQTLKTFSERRQAETKMEIAHIMSRAEMAQVEEHEKHHQEKH